MADQKHPTAIIPVPTLPDNWQQVLAKAINVQFSNIKMAFIENDSNERLASFSMGDGDMIYIMSVNQAIPVDLQAEAVDVLIPSQQQHVMIFSKAQQATNIDRLVATMAVLATSWGLCSIYTGTAVYWLHSRQWMSAANFLPVATAAIEKGQLPQEFLISLSKVAEKNATYVRSHGLELLTGFEFEMAADTSTLDTVTHRVSSLVQYTLSTKTSFPKVGDTIGISEDERITVMQRDPANASVLTLVA